MIAIESCGTAAGFAVNHRAVVPRLRELQRALQEAPLTLREWRLGSLGAGTGELAVTPSRLLQLVASPQSVPFLLSAEVLRHFHPSTALPYWTHLVAMPRLDRLSAPVLGITKEGHDSAAAIVGADGRVLCHVAEERLSRHKHERRFPSAAVTEAMHSLGLKVSDLGAVAVGHMLPWYWPLGAAASPSELAFRSIPPSFSKTDFSKRHASAHFRSHVADALGVDASRLPPILFVRHHAAHVFSALPIRTRKEACAILIADGRGEFETISGWSLREDCLTEITAAHMPVSLGYAYNSLGHVFGWHSYGFEGKIMGLAPYGKPTSRRESELAADLDSLLESAFPRRYDFPFIDVDRTVVHGGYAARRVRRLSGSGHWVSPYVFSPRFSRRLAAMVPPLAPGEPLRPTSTEHRPHAILAYCIQSRLEKTLIALASDIRERSGRAEKLIVAGGVALNAAANGTVARAMNAEHKCSMVAPPFPADDGLAIGAALALIWGAGGGVVFANERLSPFLGPSQRDSCRTNLATSRLVCAAASRATTLRQRAEEVAQLILGGHAVALFLDRGESGPRALGNRSLIFPAHLPGMDRRANRAKGREEWRPLALAMRAGRARRMFEFPFGSDYMTVVAVARKEGLSHFRSGLHRASKTSRVQIVRRDISPLLYKVLACLELHGVYGVINTSFNRDTPIVHTPRDALATFRTLSGVGHILLGDRLFSRSDLLAALERRRTPEGV